MEPEEVEPYVKSAGFFRNKANNIVARKPNCPVCPIADLCPMGQPVLGEASG